MLFRSLDVAICQEFNITLTTFELLSIEQYYKYLNKYYENAQKKIVYLHILFTIHNCFSEVSTSLFCVFHTTKINKWLILKHKLTDAVTDRMAVAKVIFGETLAKKPLSQAELEQKLTPQQLKIYEEARAAINVSLKNTAKSEIIRSLLQNDVINFDTVEKLLNQQTGFDEFIDEMLENVGARISNAQEELSQAETDVEKQAIKDELKR